MYGDSGGPKRSFKRLKSEKRILVVFVASPHFLRLTDVVPGLPVEGRELAMNMSKATARVRGHEHEATQRCQ